MQNCIKNTTQEHELMSKKCPNYEHFERCVSISSEKETLFWSLIKHQ